MKRQLICSGVAILSFGLGLTGGAILGQHDLDAKVAAAEAQTRQAQKDTEDLQRFLDHEAQNQITFNDTCWVSPRLTKYVWVRPDGTNIPVRLTWEQAWYQGSKHLVRAIAWCDK